MNQRPSQLRLEASVAPALAPAGGAVGALRARTVMRCVRLIGFIPLRSVGRVELLAKPIIGRAARKDPGRVSLRSTHPSVGSRRFTSPGARSPPTQRSAARGEGWVGAGRGGRRRLRFSTEPAPRRPPPAGPTFGSPTLPCQGEAPTGKSFAIAARRS